MGKEKIEEVKTENGVTVLKYFDTFIKIKPVEVGDESVNPDRITKIDLNNLVAEIITTPVLMNRWGTLLVETSTVLKRKKVDFEVFCAETKKSIREGYIEQGVKFTVDKVEDELVLNKQYKKFKNEIIELERENELVNSIYWAIKDKSSKLDKLSLTIQREDIEGMETTVLNGVKILIRKME